MFRKYEDITNQSLIEQLLESFRLMGPGRFDEASAIQFIELKTELEIRLEERDIYKAHAVDVQRKLLDHVDKKPG